MVFFYGRWTEIAAELAKVVCFADVEVKDSRYALVLVKDQLGDDD